MKLKTVLAIGLLAVLIVFGIREFVLSNDGGKTKDNTSANTPNELTDMQNTGLQVGEKAPDFTLDSLQGEPMSLSDFQGKQVILNFWASWCGPCRKEMPDMQKYYEAIEDEDVEIVAVNLTHFERKREHVDEFVEEFGLTFPIPLDVDKEQYDAFKVLTIPTTYFLDAEGIVRERHLGPMTYEFMEETIAKMNE